MRAAAILGLGCSTKNLKPFQDNPPIEWRMGMPAVNDGVDVILLVGGDGTIHRHLSQLVRLQVPVLVVPAGSGNDFARALGMHRMRDALAAWRKFRGGAGNVDAIDLGVISPLGGPLDVTTEPRYFCCIGGVGLDCEVARRANQLPRWLRGHGGYVLSLAPAVFKFAPLRINILASPGSASGQSEQWTSRSNRPTLVAAFANTPFHGGGMKIAPLAKIDDGLLDVCVVGKISPLKLLSVFPSVYSGRHLKIREVEYFQSSALRVETEHPLDVYADGEYVCRTPIEISVHRAALKVVVPEEP